LKSFKTPLFFLLTVILFRTPVVLGAEKQTALVREVLTGDTVRLESGKTLKFIGLQAPPLQSIIPLMRQYGSEALEFNKNKAAGKKILIEWGSQIRDDQKNFLGYVFLEDGTFINREILKAGHAKLRIIPPNIRYADEFQKCELEARRNRSGIWKDEPVNPFIKNDYVGEKNTKIFYRPNSPELDRIPQANLVTFRSRVEAKAAGFRPCSSCLESTDADF